MVKEYASADKAYEDLYRAELRRQMSTYSGSTTSASETSSYFGASLHTTDFDSDSSTPCEDDELTEYEDVYDANSEKRRDYEKIKQRITRMLAEKHRRKQRARRPRQRDDAGVPITVEPQCTEITPPKNVQERSHKHNDSIRRAIERLDEREDDLNCVNEHNLEAISLYPDEPTLDTTRLYINLVRKTKRKNRKAELLLFSKGLFLLDRPHITHIKIRD